MSCPKCGGRARVTHSFEAPGGKTQRAECESCLRVLTFLTVCVGEAEERGQGAYALAKRLRLNGEAPRVDL